MSKAQQPTTAGAVLAKFAAGAGRLSSLCQLARSRVVYDWRNGRCSHMFADGSALCEEAPGRAREITGARFRFYARVVDRDFGKFSRAWERWERLSVSRPERSLDFYLPRTMGR